MVVAMACLSTTIIPGSRFASSRHHNPQNALRFMNVLTNASTDCRQYWVCFQLSVDLNCRGGLPQVRSAHCRHHIIESMHNEFAAAHSEGDACEGANVSTTGVIEMVKLEESASYQNLVIGKRREPLLLHRQSVRGCCSSDLCKISFVWNNFFARFHACLDISVKVAGPLYVLLAFSLISCVIYLFLVSVLPAIHDLSSWQGMGHLCIAGWLAFNVFFNYICCIYTDPGISPHPSDAVMEAMPGARYEMDLEGLGYTTTRWCKRCRKPKPPMTHHCHICKRCILKMDHHCPWMHNCIGYYNYRFFFIFLLYMWAGCLYAATMSSIPMFKPDDEDSDDDDVGVIFTFILSVAVLISLSFLLGWHVYLVLTAQTTIDFYGNRQRRREARAKGEAWSNVYSLGKLQNLRQVLDVGGRYWWLWIVLPTRARPRGDGIHFPVKESSFHPLLSSQPVLSLGDALCSSTTPASIGNSLVSDRGSMSRERILNDGQWAAAERL